MDGLECSEILKSELEFSGRIDAEYYQKKYLAYQDIINRHDVLPLFKIADFLIGPFGSAYDTSSYVEQSDYRYIRGQDVKPFLYGDNVIEKRGINRDRTGDREKTRYLCGKQGIFARDRALIRPGSIRQLETRASTRSASFFHALGSPGRPDNGGGAAGAYRTHNGAKPLKQGHLRAKRGPLGPSRKSQQQTKRTGFAAHGHSIAETAPESKRASCANGALIRA